MACSRGCCPTQAAHFKSLQLQRPQAADRRRADFALAADLVAYKNLRDQGYQPPTTRGTYDLTRRATTDAEIERGVVVAGDPTERRRGAHILQKSTELAKEPEAWQPLRT